MLPMWLRLAPLTLAEWRHHPWRHAVAMLAVALGVALASSVQMINHSALSEFAQAVRSVNGQPDVVLAARWPEGFDDALLHQLAGDELVAAASPVLALEGLARLAVDQGQADLARRDGQPRVLLPEGQPRPAQAQGQARLVERATANAAPLALRILGIDALQVASVAPDLAPVLAPGAATSAALTAVIDPGLAWLNPGARARLAARDGDALELATPQGWLRLRVAGSVAAGGGPLVALDIAAVQQHFARAGRLSRIDLRLAAGVDREAWLRRQALPQGVRAAAADDATQRMSTLSRAYRVNLSVLALVALLVGGFLVYSVVSLSVAQRLPALALLGVLGVAAGQRRQWILAESAVLGALGSLLGLALGAGLAALALRLLGGDLGGGYFAGVAPSLAWPVPALATCAALGLLAAVLGAWWPARQAQGMAPVMVLKGQGMAFAAGQTARWPAPALLLAAALLALLPPVAGLPLAAYASVALCLAGGVAAVPWVVGWVLARWPGGDALGAAGGRGVGPQGGGVRDVEPRGGGVRDVEPRDAGVRDGEPRDADVRDGEPRGAAEFDPKAHAADPTSLVPGALASVPSPVQPGGASRVPALALLWLARQRAHFSRHAASATVAGVVASLALSVALTVMVASFREAVSQWLDQVLPAEMYVRAGVGGTSGARAGLPAASVAAVAALPGVARVQPGQTLALQIDARQPAVALLARPMTDPQKQLPMLAEALPAPPGAVAIYISEPAAAIHGWAPGQTITLPLPHARSAESNQAQGQGQAPGPARAQAVEQSPEQTSGQGQAQSEAQPLFIRGVFRDYARQFGSVAIDLADYQRLTGDLGINDLSLWLVPGTSAPALADAIKALAGTHQPLEVASLADLRRLSLAIFDRSFAVTRYLQMVAIGVGLVGVVASLSAQVLARRKEFGLLAHLGLTRRQCMALVTLETLAWLFAGCLLGLALGLAMAAVLVHVVNPQSFHWTMDMHIPAARLAALAGTVMLVGGLAAAFSARRAAAAQAVLAVKEDW